MNDFASLTKKKKALTPRALCPINVPLTQLSTRKTQILIWQELHVPWWGEAEWLHKPKVGSLLTWD